MAIKNEVEIEGLRNAYIRDGVAFVRFSTFISCHIIYRSLKEIQVQFLVWLESRLKSGYAITEWEAAWRMKEFRMSEKKMFLGLAYETVSASGPNAALPHYTPKKHSANMIDGDLPYLK